MLQKLLILVNFGAALVNCQVCFPGEPCGGENKGTGEFGDYFEVKDNIPTEEIITSKYNYNTRHHKVTNNKHVFVIRKLEKVFWGCW